jgi:uncharacterized protein YndB with AHSA1/START domain
MSTFRTEREISATPERVFAAFAAPERLAKWWGPKGFRNTFKVCEFSPGGAWQFTMHGPDGTDYWNESVFLEIVHNQKIVIHHVCAPRFHLTVTLAPSASGTHLTWTQQFEEATFAEAVRHIVVPANEENLDRLTAEVLSGEKNAD